MVECYLLKVVHLTLLSSTYHYVSSILIFRDGSKKLHPVWFNPLEYLLATKLSTLHCHGSHKHTYKEKIQNEKLEKYGKKIENAFKCKFSFIDYWYCTLQLYCACVGSVYSIMSKV